MFCDDQKGFRLDHVLQCMFLARLRGICEAPLPSLEPPPSDTYSRKCGLKATIYAHCKLAPCRLNFEKFNVLQELLPVPLFLPPFSLTLVASFV